jgi:hypothetical protein
MQADKIRCESCVDIHTEIQNVSLDVSQFIETMELLHVQGPKNNIEAVGDYLRADGPFERKNDNFDPVPGLKKDMEYIYT